MRVVIVNEKDEVLGYKDRDDRNQDDIIRVSGLWLYNSNNEILIAQRAHAKVHHPGMWGPAVSGTVEEGETYLSNIIKEAREEIGITLTEDQVVPSIHTYRETSHKYFVQHFSAKIDLPIEDFKIQKDEVEQIRWISPEELANWLETKPEDFLVSFPESFRKWKSSVGI